VISPQVNPAEQKYDIMILLDNILETSYASKFMFNPYLLSYSAMLFVSQRSPVPEAHLPAGFEVGSTFEDVGWKVSKDGLGAFGDTGDATENFKPYLTTFGFAPNTSQAFYGSWNALAEPPTRKTMKETNPFKSVWWLLDVMGQNEFTWKSHPIWKKEIEFSWLNFAQQNIYNDAEILDSILQVNNVIKGSKFKPDQLFAFAVTNIFWTAFLALDNVTWMLCFVNFIGISLFSFLILGSVRAAIVGGFVSSMIALEVYGLLMIFLKFNPFIVATILAAAGLSVECISHTLAAFFLEATGSLQNRLGAAMKQTFLPVVHGSFSTFATILPIFWADMKFMWLYQATAIFCVLLVSAVNGFLFLPAFLGCAFVD